MTTVQPPIDLKKWIEQNADKFQPQVSNRYLYDGRDFFVSRQMFRIPRSGRRTRSVWLSSGAVRLEKKNTSFSTAEIAGHWLKTSILTARTSSSISARRCSISGMTMHAALARNAERKFKSHNRCRRCRAFAVPQRIPLRQRTLQYREDRSPYSHFAA